jgi:hypothetical protein
MKKFTVLSAISIAALPFLVSVSAVNADEVMVPVSQQSPHLTAIERPTNGMSMQAVEAKYGQAMSMGETVGQPPITMWEYDNFNVYFEHNLVIHTVLKHQRPSGTQ